jgi:hypothetical protein
MQQNEVESHCSCIMHQSAGKGGTSARGDDDRKGGTVDTLVHSADIGTVLEKDIDHIGMSIQCRNVQRYRLAVPVRLA